MGQLDRLAAKLRAHRADHATLDIPHPELPELVFRYRPPDDETLDRAARTATGTGRARRASISAGILADCLVAVLDADGTQLADAFGPEMAAAFDVPDGDDLDATHVVRAVYQTGHLIGTANRVSELAGVGYRPEV